MKLSFNRTVIFAVGVAVLSLCLIDHTPLGTECERSASPDVLYTAERCLLKWVPGGNSEYVGRLFDAKSGKKLAQRRFSTPAPDLMWSPHIYYSLRPETPPRYTGPSVQFSSGDPVSGNSGIFLPPSKWDKFLAAR